jgi:hypothetical protein
MTWTSPWRVPRVLKPGGCVVVFVPDLEGVEATDEVLYEAPCGPITGLDLIYGLRSAWPQPHMAHHTGFVRDTLERPPRRRVRRLREADPDFNLMGGGDGMKVVICCPTYTGPHQAYIDAMRRHPGARRGRHRPPLVCSKFRQPLHLGPAPRCCARR